MITRMIRIGNLKENIAKLEGEKQSLKNEVETLKHQRKIEEEDLKHMIKIKEEKLEIQFKKKEMDLELEKQKEVEKVRNDYRDKIESLLGGQITNIKEMYSEIIKLLPNVNFKLKGSL